MSGVSELATVYVFRLGEAYDDLTPTFAVDGRDYTDPAEVTADVKAAADTLTRLNLIADYETSRADPDGARSGLPSWPQWRARHIEGGEPIGVRPRPAKLTFPPGWDEMGVWLEHSHRWLREQVSGAAGAVAGGRVSLVADPGPERVSRGSVVPAEEQYRVDCSFMVVPPEGHTGQEALDAIAGRLRAAGWALAEPIVKPGSTIVGATHTGHEIAAVWRHERRSVTLLGKSPTVDATYFQEGSEDAANL